MNTRFTHNLLNEDVIEFLRLDRLACFIDLVFENIESKALFLLKCLINEELVAFIGVREQNDLLAVLIDMGLVVGILLDRLLWGDKFADVNS